MIQSCREPDLTQKPLRSERRREIGMQHLERDDAIVLDVLRQIHCRHSAAAELAIDYVALGERFPQRANQE